MTDKLGSNVIQLQKEIMDITKNIYSVRMKTHKSMSSILNGLKSFSKNKQSKQIQNKNPKKYKKIIDNQNFIINNDEDKDKNNNNYYQKNNTLNNLLFKRNCRIILNENENQYITNNKIEKTYKNCLLLDSFNNKKRNKPIKCEINNFRNSELNKYDLNHEYYTSNDDNNYNSYQVLDKKKGISKTDSLKYLYKDKRYSNNITYNGNNIYDEGNYYQKKERNFSKRELNPRENANGLFNYKFDINAKSNKKSRNKNKNEFKYKEKEIQKNREESFGFEDFFSDKGSKTFYYDFYQKHNNNYNKDNNSFSKKQNKIITNPYKSNLNHYNSNKNIFRKKASTKANSKEKKNRKYNDFYLYNNQIEEMDNINNIFKILNVKNYKDCLYKIHKLLSYEDFIHNIKNIYYQFNDNNNNFNLKDILYWLSFHLNKDNKENKYEAFCKEVMGRYNISNFDNFKKFFNKLVDKDRNNKHFVNGMKELFNSFNEFQPNQTLYKNKNRNKFQKLIYKNEDDINELK